MEHTTCLFLVTFWGKPTCYYLIPAMPKGVNLPGNLRPPTFAKSALEGILRNLTLRNQNASIAYLEELNPKAHVIDDGGIVGGSLVVHRPSTTNELKPWKCKVK